MIADIKINKDREFVVTGTLSFASVPELEKIGCDLLIEHENYIFNLKELKEANIADDSALALLLSWARFAKKIKKEIIFKNLPAKLLNIIKLGGLENVLPIK